MENFTAYNPVHVHFGKQVIKELAKTVSQYGKNILLIYGGGSVKNNGSYDDVINQLSKISANVTEYSGIKSNPVITDVEKAVKRGIENNVDVVIGLGGGSVMDTAKLVAFCIPDNIEPWKVMKYRVFSKKALPSITIPTLAATGSEMNALSVIQNDELKEKAGYGNPLLYPKHAFLNPEYTFSVSKDYTAYGIADIIAHSFESFFAKGEANLSDRFVQAIVLETMKYSQLVLNQPENYQYRANIMWNATCALNGITAYGRSRNGDFGAHAIGHTLSSLYDTPHGASLSIAYPAWFKLQKNRFPERITKLAKLIFNTNSIDNFILKLESFFKQIGSPIRLSEIGISEDKKEDVVELMKKNKVSGYVISFENGDYEKLFDFMK